PATPRDQVDVVELHLPCGAAPPPVLADVGAPASVTRPHLLLHLRGDAPLALAARRELLLLQRREQELEGFDQDGLVLPARVLVAHEVTSLLDNGAQRVADRTLEEVALRRGRQHAIPYLVEDVLGQL